MDQYDHKKIEEKWRKVWEEAGIYEAPKKPKNKKYVLDMYPYPSGEGLHVGHPLGYIRTDIVARYYRMKGFDVLHPMGWDAFGLPAENFAIKKGIHPKITTEKAANRFRQQLKNISLSYDWSREIDSSKPDYYKWTQWFFLLFYKNGLAYQKEALVNWCPSCNTSLANEQVIKKDGKNVCERCETEVEKRDLMQWFFGITKYADRLLSDLDKIDWPQSTKEVQSNWIGKKQGININYEIEGLEEKVICFTTRPDTNFGATFVVIAPEHKLVDIFKEKTDPKTAKKITAYVEKSINKTELDRISEGREKTGVFTGFYAISQLNKSKMPIYISDFVLGTVGTGAVVGVPGHDKRDFAFAKAFDIPIVRVVVAFDEDDSLIEKIEQVQEDEGTMVNSDFLNGMDITDAIRGMMDYLEEKGWGERVTTWKLRDWLVSRQRYWGAPIPIIYCTHCAENPENTEEKTEKFEILYKNGKKVAVVPVPEKDLPLLLPEDVDFKPTGQSPLVDSKTFHTVSCPVCGRSGEGVFRESDTIDTFVCSSWYYYRFCDPHNTKEFASKDAIQVWMPVDLYVGGAEHTVLHLLYARFFTKVLSDLGYISFNEPFASLRHQGTILGPDGRKMSKRWGNIINPDDVVENLGADTLRMYEMFMGPPNTTLTWNIDSINGIRRFITRIWAIYQDESKIKEKTTEQLSEKIHWVIKKIGEDVETLSFNTAIAAMMECINVWELADEFMSKDDAVSFLKVLAPFAPHFAEELWFILNQWKTSSATSEFMKKNTIHLQAWPSFNDSLAQGKSITIAIQVSGKLRGTLELERKESGWTKTEIEDKAKSLQSVQKYLGEDSYKIIYVPDKLINFVVS